MHKTSDTFFEFDDDDNDKSDANYDDYEHDDWHVALLSHVVSHAGSCSMFLAIKPIMRP